MLIESAEQMRDTYVPSLELDLAAFRNLNDCNFAQIFTNPIKSSINYLLTYLLTYLKPTIVLNIPSLLGGQATL